LRARIGSKNDGRAEMENMSVTHIAAELKMPAAVLL
jgi:hypothetical protein